MTNIKYFGLCFLLSLSLVCCTVKRDKEQDATRLLHHYSTFTSKGQNTAFFFDTLDVVILTHDTIREEGKAPQIRHTRKEVKAKRKAEKVEEEQTAETLKAQTAERVKTIEKEEQHTNIKGWTISALWFGVVLLLLFLTYRAFRR